MHFGLVLLSFAAFTYNVKGTLHSGRNRIRSHLDSAVETGKQSWQVLLHDSFENGMGNWLDGGSDAHISDTRASDGQKSVRLRDNSSSSKITMKEDIAISGYDQLQVKFSFYAYDMENNEDFFLDISRNGGSSWDEVQFWRRPSINNDEWYYDETVIIDSSAYPFTDQTRLRFRMDASSDGDKVYLDDIEIAVTGSSSGPPPPAPPSPTPPSSPSPPGPSPPSPSPPSPSPPSPSPPSPTFPPLEDIGDCSSSSTCGNCQGDCDHDGHCGPGLVCADRSGGEDVPGCNGNDGSGTDYCYEESRAPANQLKHVGDGPYPLGECKGDCDYDSDCAPGLLCYQRSSTQDVPGCVGMGISGKDYCYNPNPTPSQPAPTPPTPTGSVTYTPGDMENGITEGGLVLCKGLRVKIIAERDRKVDYDSSFGGGQSNDYFHIMPDGAGVIQDPNDSNCYAYVSNSEGKDPGTGGVGSITLCDGKVKEYKRLLSGTRRNCSGGRTPHGTWLSCEEHSDGSIWEVNPFAKFSNNQHWQETKMAYDSSGNVDFDKFESVACDHRDPLHPKYYITIDSSDGDLRRFEPHSQSVSDLTQNGTVTYLELLDGGSSGKYRWTSDKSDGVDSAQTYFPNCEGIEFDEKSGKLFFISKELEALFILDIDGDTYERILTDSIIGNGHLDQLKLVCSANHGNEAMLYFSQDGGDRGIWARTPDGNFYQIVDGSSYSGDESSGVALSPDNKFMYLAMQDVGLIFQFWRHDGHYFDGTFNTLGSGAIQAQMAAHAAAVARRPELEFIRPHLLTPTTVNTQGSVRTPISLASGLSSDGGSSKYVRPGMAHSSSSSTSAGSHDISSTSRDGLGLSTRRQPIPPQDANRRHVRK